MTEHTYPLLAQIAVPLIAAFIGALAALAAQFLSNHLKNRSRRRKLRKSLKAEIEHMNWLKETDLVDLRDQMEDQGIAHTYFPTSVFDSMIDDLGLLTENELEKIISYYSSAHVAQEQLENINKGEGDVTIFVERTLDNAVGERNDAIEEIENHL